MTETIRIINLKVTNVQETETETDSGTTNKWTYTLQDEEKENTVTLKSDTERKITLGDTLDIKIGNEQTTLDIHITNEAEALTDIIDEQGLMDKVIEETEKHPELANIVKDRLAEYHKLTDQKEALRKLLKDAKAAEKEELDMSKKKVPPGTPSKKKETPAKPAKQKKWREPSATSPRGQALQRLRKKAKDPTLRPTEEEIQEEK